MGRPSLTFNEIKSVCATQYCVNVKSYKRLLSFRDTNYLLETSGESDVRYGLKWNTDDMNSQLIMKVSAGKNFDLSHAELQRLITNHLLQEGFVCSRFLLQSNDDYLYCMEKTSEEGINEKYYIRLLTFLPGSTLKDHLEVLDQRTTIKDIGELVAKLHISLENLDRENSVNITSKPDEPWILENLSLLREYLTNYQNEKKTILQYAIDSFIVNAVPRCQNLPRGIIHGDIHDMNIIVNCNEARLNDMRPTSDKGSDVRSKYGIIDFEDMTRSCFVFEIAAVIRDFMVDVTCVDSLHVAAYFLTGYLKYRMLIKEEFDILLECIKGGLCQYVVLAEHELKLQPDNAYVGYGAESAWNQLQKIHHVPRDTILKSWRTILRESGFDVLTC